MKDRSPWDILIAEMSYFLTVMLALAAGYYFWKINLLPKFTDESPHGLLYSIPFLVLFELAMVIVFLFTLRRVLLKSRRNPSNTSGRGAGTSTSDPAPDGSRPQAGPGMVSLVKTRFGIREALIESLDLIGGIGRYVGRGDRVLLKPNLNGVDGFTDGTLVEALIGLLYDFGARSSSPSPRSATRR
jgi:hypothetical protein